MAVHCGGQRAHLGAGAGAGAHLPVVHVDGAGLVGGGLGVPDEARRRADGGPRRVPGVAVGRLARDDGDAALGEHGGDHVALVRDERLHGLDGAVGEGDDLGGGAGAADGRTVRGRRRAAGAGVSAGVREGRGRGGGDGPVVVAELDHDVVAGVDLLHQRVKQALARVRARRAPAAREVDDLEAHVLRERGAPPASVVSRSEVSARHGRQGGSH